MRLLEGVFNSKLHSTLVSIFSAGIESEEFSSFDLTAAVELFMAVNHHANRAVLFGRWSKELGQNYHTLALKALEAVTGIKLSNMRESK